MNRKNIFILCAATVFLLLVFYCLWRQSVPEPEIYEYVYPVKRDIVRKALIQGHIGSRNQVSVFPDAPGVLARLSVKNGDRVRKGQELAVLVVSPQMDVTEEYLANEQTARISFEQAERDEKRAKDLLGKGAISKRDYENALNALETSRKALALASSRINRNRGLSVIEAPVNGVVCNLKLVAGSSVSMQTPICGIFDPETMIFIGRADETDIDPMKEGMDMVITPGANKRARIPARISYVSEVGEDYGGVTGFEIRADILDDSISHLRMGYSANGAVVIERKDNVLSIEEAYIYYDPEPFVWILSSNPGDVKRQKWEKVYVTTGISDGVNMEIAGDISEESTIRGHKK